MAEIDVRLRNPSGLHARPAALFVKTATGFTSDIRVANLTRDAEKSADGKSLLAVLGLGVSQDHEVRVVAEGDDADEALRVISELVKSGLGEPVEAE